MNFYKELERIRDNTCAECWANLDQEILRIHQTWKLYLDGSAPSPLFVDQPRHEREAIDWALNSSDQNRLEWLYREIWETGIFCDYEVIIFPQIRYDAGEPEIDFITIYRLDGVDFPPLQAGTPPVQSVELDQHGNLIIDIEPLPVAGDLCLWRYTFDELLKFKDSHHGRTPEQEAEYQEKRKQWRQNDYLKNKGTNK